MTPLHKIGLCKDCSNFDDIEKHEDGFLIGSCEVEPFDMREMISDQCAVVCGHDGYVVVGENFGCIHFQKKEESENDTAAA